MQKSLKNFSLYVAFDVIFPVANLFSVVKEQATGTGKTVAF